MAYWHYISAGAEICSSSRPGTMVSSITSWLQLLRLTVFSAKLDRSHSFHGSAAKACVVAAFWFGSTSPIATLARFGPNLPQDQGAAAESCIGLGAWAGQRAFRSEQAGTDVRRLPGLGPSSRMRTPPLLDAKLEIF